MLLYLFVDYGRPQDVLPIGFMRLGMIFTLILCLFILTQGKFRLCDSNQTRMIFYFIILLCAYVPFARNNYFAWKTAKQILLYLPFILSTIYCVRSISRLRQLLFVSIAIMIYVSLYSIYNKGQGSGNYFQDENDIALYINVYLPFCYFLFLKEKEKSKKLFYGFAFIIGLIAIVKSFSRGGFVGLVCLTFVIWMSSKRKIKTLIFLSLLAILIYSYSGELYRKEISTVTRTSEATAIARFKIWEGAWKMFLDNPLGVGGMNFAIRFPEYQPDWFGRNMWGTVTHSLWFTLVTELGIFGILIYFSLLYYNLQDIFFITRMHTKNDQDQEYIQVLSLAFLAAFAGYFASATFLSVLYYPYYWFLTGMLVATKRIAVEFIEPL